MIKTRLFKFALFVYALLIVTPNESRAQYFTGAVAGGAGNAGVAAAEVSESSFLNPAMIAHAPAFSVGFFYREGFVEGEMGTTDLGLNLVDNSEGILIPGAIGYIQRAQRMGAGEPVNERYGQFAIGNFVAPGLSAGATVYYLESSTEEESFDQINGHFGLFFTPNPDFGLGLVYYNVGSVSDDVPEVMQQKKAIRIGTNYIFNRHVRVRLDISRQQEDNPDKKLEIGGGLESFLNEFFVLRLGWNSHSLLDRELLTAGLSFVGPRFSLDYSYQESQSEGAIGPLHSVDLRAPF